MTNSDVFQLRIPPEIAAAAAQYCKANGGNLSQFLLQAACEKLGREDLKATIRRRGRTRKPPE